MRPAYWYWNKVFSLKEIKEINKIINKNKRKAVEDHAASDSTKTSTVEQIDYKIVKNYLQDILSKAHSAKQYNFGYSLYYPLDVDILNYNIYNSKTNGQYDWHVDTSNNYINDIKLTLLINLSDKDYTGGEFFIKQNALDLEIQEFNKPGDVLMFKSHILHKVAPLLSGERKTLAYFLTGPRFI